MLIQRVFLFYICIVLVTAGCQTYSSVRDQEYYLNKARDSIENYRMANRKEFYSFVLGEELKGRENYNGEPDEETGGVNYYLKDPRDVFEAVRVTTNKNGIVLKIEPYKKFNTKNEGLIFFNTIAERLKATYPVETYPAYKTMVDKDFARIIILVAENDNDWLKKYSDDLRRKDQGSYLGSPFGFCYILHPTLAKIECTFMKFREYQDVYLVTLAYTSKKHLDAKKLHKKELQHKLGQL